MSLKTSTGLRNALLDSNPLATVLDLGFVKIYSGTPPTTADDSISGATLLCTISNNSTGTGVKFETAAAGGALPKESTEVWSGVNVASGTASFYRHVAVGDTGVSSTTQPRIQGLVNTFGGEMNLTSTTLTNGATQTIDFYTVALPTL